MSPAYLSFYDRVLSNWVAHIRQYPKEMQERVAFVQVKTGSSGDEAPYKGKPKDSRYTLATAFELDPRWLVEAGSRRQKWLDQAQSLNLYMSEPNGKKLDNLYKLAWIRGLKTTYYLRSMGATHVEKSTMADATKANRLSAVGGSYIALDRGKVNGSAAPQACSILDPECESCQ